MLSISQIFGVSYGEPAPPHGPIKQDHIPDPGQARRCRKPSPKHSCTWPFLPRLRNAKYCALDAAPHLQSHPALQKLLLSTALLSTNLEIFFQHLHYVSVVQNTLSHMETGLLELFSSQLQMEPKENFYTWCTQRGARNTSQAPLSCPGVSPRQDEDYHISSLWQVL